VAARKLSPFFKLAFFTLLGLTLVFYGFAFGTGIVLADPTKTQDSAINSLTSAGSTTLAALIGLFVGKVA
jgi:ABC-type phosphate transport system substrate-binding protein